MRADEPLIIENKALGYTIRYQLEEFYFDFNSNITLYLGYPFFQEMDAGNRKKMNWKEQRSRAYLGSLTHFMKCLFNDQLKQQGFQVIRTIKMPNLEKQRITELYKTKSPASDTFQVQKNGDLAQLSSKPAFSADSIAYYNKVLSQKDFYDKYLLLPADSVVSSNNDGTKSFFFTGKLRVIYTDPKQEHGYNHSVSEIYLVTPAPIQIEKNGSYYPPQEILASGYWSVYEKVAYILPSDYNINDD